MNAFSSLASSAARSPSTSFAYVSHSQEGHSGPSHSSKLGEGNQPQPLLEFAHTTSEAGHGRAHEVRILIIL